jgi:hypothetical protein
MSVQAWGKPNGLSSTKARRNVLFFTGESQEESVVKSRTILLSYVDKQIQEGSQSCRQFVFIAQQFSLLSLSSQPS